MKKKFKTWHYILFFVLALLLALIFTLPVQVVLSRIDLPKDIRLSDVDGTLLKGKARQVKLHGFPMKSVTYRYRPSCIALFKVCYRIRYRRGKIDIAFDPANGAVEISHAKINYAAKELVVHFPDLPVRPSGRLELVINDLLVVDGKPTKLAGKMIWRGLGLDDEGIKIDIGNMRFDFTGNPKRYDIKIKDLDASLQVDGKGRIQAGGKYNFEIKIDSRSSIDPQVKYVLELISKRDGFNSYQIKQSGRLSKDITRQLF